METTLEALVVYSASLSDWKEPETLGLFRTIDSAKKACEARATKYKVQGLKWKLLEGGTWQGYNDLYMFYVRPIDVQS